ncbi:MAG TPA: hypothetical protein VHN59_10120 [Chitinophagaceae bacterium]|nr:hypothetical protein [Chitinophagaceae bacterium]
MKKLCGLLLTGLILIYSCQKEVSLENGEGVSSEGTLQSDVTGDCLPKEIGGTYEAGVALAGTANTIEVQVNVLKTGTYLIYTDTVNGYFFRGTGSFLATGMNTVTLQGNGTPLLESIDNFTVRYGTSECIIPVTVLPAGSGGPAEFTFNGSPGTCMDFAASGDYVMGVALTSGNTVAIKVNVTTAGTYSISTTASNGMTFAGTGTLLTGAQIITLTGSGTPVAAGTTDIPLTAGSTTCSFSVDVLGTPIAKDYFPLTAGSNWSYELDDNANDSLLVRVKAGTVTIGGNLFNTLEGTKDLAIMPFQDMDNYRKSGGDYYHYVDLKDYLEFEASQKVEFVFLKDDQAAGYSWTTPEYSGTIQGIPVKVRIKFTIVQKDINHTVATSLGSVTYPNTIVVQEKYEYDPGIGSFIDGTPFYGIYRDYYVRNIGWVYDEHFLDAASTTPNSKAEMRRSQIAP